MYQPQVNPKVKPITLTDVIRHKNKVYEIEKPYKVEPTPEKEMVKLIKKVVIAERPKSPKIIPAKPLKHMMTLKKSSDLRKEMFAKIDRLERNTMKK